MILLLFLAAISGTTHSFLWSKEWGVNKRFGLVDTALVRFNVATGPKWLRDDGSACKNGTRQSPVNLLSACERIEFKNPLKWSGMANTSRDGFLLFNTGEFAQISPVTDDPFIITNGPLKSAIYNLLHVHFHWGKTNDVGSEHTFNGAFTAMEAHFVFFKAEYGGLLGALENSDGIVVVAVPMVLSASDNPALNPIISKLPQVHELSPTPANVAPNALDWMSTVFSNSKYKSYLGSLTSEPCNEIVTWIVMEQTLPVSGKQVEEFRKIKNSDGEQIRSSRKETRAALLGRQVRCPCLCRRG